MTKSGAAQPDPRPNAGDYNACSPRVAKLAQQPFTAPEADLNALAHTGFSMAESHPTWTKTPGKTKS